MGRIEIVAGTVSPSDLPPIQSLRHLEKIMNEYVGGPVASSSYQPV
jgi:hypothetical protein